MYHEIIQIHKCGTFPELEIIADNLHLQTVIGAIVSPTRFIEQLHGPSSDPLCLFTSSRKARGFVVDLF